MNGKLEFNISRSGRRVLIDLDKPLFYFDVKDNKKRDRVSSAECMLEPVRNEDNTTFVSFLYQTEAFQIQFSITYHLEPDELLSQISCEVTGNGQVESIQYPISRIAELSVQDQLLISSAWGDNIERPSKTIHDVSTSTSIRFGQDYIRYAEDEIIYTYPSIMAMQYMVLYNSSHSVYISTYSTGDETMTYHAKSTGKYDLELSIQHYPFLDHGSWSSPLCSQSILKGDWHTAARLYRTHMAAEFPKADSPEWMSHDFHGWAQFALKYENKDPGILYRELPELYENVQRRLGLEDIYVAAWSGRGHDTEYPDCRICEPLGTGEELHDALASIHKLGGRCILYTNGRQIDNQTDYYYEVGKFAVCRDETGEPYLEEYGSTSKFETACPGESGYYEKMGEVTQEFIQTYNADGMFIDQISCCVAPFCHDKTHSHSKPGNHFLPGVEKELTIIRNRHKSLNPDYYTVAEGCHERFSSFYDVNQSHGEEYTWQIGKSLPEQFIYTFPDRIVTGLCQNKHQLYHTMSQFKPVDITESCYADETTHPVIRSYVQMRKQYPQFFFHATFKDDDEVFSPDHTKVSRVLSEDASNSICIYQSSFFDDEHHSSVVQLDFAYSECKPMYPEDLQITVLDGMIKADWTGPICFFYVT